jgi:hypothetical protein
MIPFIHVFWWWLCNTIDGKMYKDNAFSVLNSFTPNINMKLYFYFAHFLCVCLNALVELSYPCRSFFRNEKRTHQYIETYELKYKWNFICLCGRVSYTNTTSIIFIYFFYGNTKKQWILTVKLFYWIKMWLNRSSAKSFLFYFIILKEKLLIYSNISKRK